jgi:lipopolysaccharide export system protein LptC
MIDRRYWLAVVVLALVAAATQILVWFNRPPVDAQVYSGPPRSDYTLADFTMNALDEQGKLSFAISGPRLARRGEDGSIYVTDPRYTLVDRDGLPWLGRSDAAWVDKGGTVMKLQGEVLLERRAEAGVQPATIRTADLTTWPKTGQLETAAPARIEQPGSILRGTGLRGDMNTNVLELLSDVHSTFEPRPRRR